MTHQRKKIEWRDSKAIAIYMNSEGLAIEIHRRPDVKRAMFNEDKHTNRERNHGSGILSYEGKMYFEELPSHRVNNNFWEVFYFRESLIIRKILKDTLDFILDDKNDSI